MDSARVITTANAILLLSPLEQADTIEWLKQVLELVRQAEGDQFWNAQLRRSKPERGSEVDAHHSSDWLIR